MRGIRRAIEAASGRVARRCAEGADPAQARSDGVKHIGIVACSAEGAALCYRTFCVEGAARMREYIAEHRLYR